MTAPHPSKDFAPAVASAAPHSPPVKGDDRQRLMRLASIASLVVATSMIVAKLLTWMLTDSVGMLASLADSLLDLVASAVTFWAIRAAAAPPDEEHRFGHGKAEPIAALAQAGFVIGTSVLVAVQAVHQLINPMPLSHVGVGMVVMAAACVLTGGLVLLQRWVYQQTHSVAVKADSLHYQADLGINLAVLAAFVVTEWLGWWWLDGVMALGIALVLLRSAWHIGRSAMDMLMDRELPDNERALIVQTVQQHGGVASLHDLKTRMAGADRFIQMHLEMDGQLSLYQAHALSDQVEEALRQLFPQAEIIIHQDPVGVETIPDMARV